MPKKVAVIDGNSLMHRAYHAVPPTMNAPDGTPTNAVFGFISMMLKFIDIANPDALICAFDKGKPEFRIKALQQYKAQRPPMDEELHVQFPIIQELLQAMNIPVVMEQGWEGDDILGTISARDEHLDYQTLLVTGDKDAYQLATDKTQIVTTKKGITDVAIYGPAEVVDRYGVTPAQFPDFLGLMGDSSDNIPGVPGIGPKTAAKLLQSYGSLDGIYEHLSDLKGKQLENLQNNKDSAYLSRDIATIVRNLKFKLDLEDVHFPSFTAEAVEEAFGKYRLNSHLARVLQLIGAQTQRKQARLTWEPIKTGDEGVSLVQAAIEDQELLGVVAFNPEQISLFNPMVTVAFSGQTGTAVLEGEQALESLAQVIRQGVFAAMDVKQLVHHVFPADTSQQTYVSEEDLLGMNAFDLGLAGYILDSSTSEYSLAALLDEYIGGSLPESHDDSVTAAINAAACRMLVDPLRAAIKKDGSQTPYFEIDLPLIAVLAQMERTGAALDCQRLQELGTSTKAELEGLTDKIYEEAGEQFNIDSPKQLSHILFEVMGMNPIKKTRSGYSTDASVLTELAKTHELPALILRYRELTKIKSTYIDALQKVRGDDGRVHTQFNETVTTTGRLSSSDPNLQNIPVRTDFGRQIRACFVPLNPGEKFLSADYSQIELRLLAHLSGDEHLIAAFKSGADFHASTAARVFDVPIDKVTPQLRSRAKAVNFGIVYGQQAYGLSQSLDIPYAEAKEMIDRYFTAYPGVRQYLDAIVASAKEKGYAETMFGRKRHIPELKSSNAQRRSFGERTAMNHPMQGSAADIIKLAMNEVQRRLLDDGYHAKLLLQVHDELDFSVPEDEVERLAAMVDDVMEHVVQLKVPLIADVAWGDNWSEAH